MLLGIHDDARALDHHSWAAKGVVPREFPKTEEAAQIPAARGNPIKKDAMILVSGGSHKKKISALELVQEGLCSTLVLDNHFPSPRLAALALAKEIGLPAAWHLVSAGPAAILEL